MVRQLDALAYLLEWKDLAGAEGGNGRENDRRNMTRAVDKSARKSDFNRIMGSRVTLHDAIKCRAKGEA